MTSMNNTFGHAHALLRIKLILRGPKKLKASNTGVIPRSRARELPPLFLQQLESVAVQPRRLELL